MMGTNTINFIPPIFKQNFDNFSRRIAFYCIAFLQTNYNKYKNMCQREKMKKQVLIKLLECSGQNTKKIVLDFF